MKISDFLRPADVRGELAAGSVPEVLAELCRPVASSEPVDGQLLLDKLLAREGLGSTAIGDGVALPHCKVTGLSGLRATVGRSTGGVDFASIDGKPTHLFVALFSPATGPGLHLHALARVSRVLKDPALRASLRAARDEVEMYQLIIAADTAADARA